MCVSVASHSDYSVPVKLQLLNRRNWLTIGTCKALIGGPVQIEQSQRANMIRQVFYPSRSGCASWPFGRLVSGERTRSSCCWPS